jgi:integrase
MAYGVVPDFVRRLQGCNGGEGVKLAFELLVLTAARTGELVNARWAEVDLKAAVWTVPAERMKAKQEHRVPLSIRAVEILAQARELAGMSDFIFPGRLPARPMSNMAFLMTLRRMGDRVTAHGFRSAFRDWASERTNFPLEVCERALAHTIRNKVEAAYRRGDLLEKRRELMEPWAAFVASSSAEIFTLRAS